MFMGQWGPMVEAAQAQNAAPTPGSQEAIQQLLSLAQIEPRRAMLQGQLEQAQALRRGGKQHPRPLSLGAGIANGLNDSLDSAAGWLQEHNLRPQEEALMKEEEAKRGSFAKLPGAQELILKALTGGGQF
jgi:hypothetical protein